jgi:protein gp37
MGKTSIEWTEHTWNPVRGCSMAKGSEAGGCLNCYAARIAAQNRPAQKSPTTGEAFAKFLPPGPRWTGKVELIPEMLEIPLKRRKPTTFFVNSMSDLFHEALPVKDRRRVFDTMCEAPQHRYQILTKRAQVMKEFGVWWCMQHVEPVMPSNWWLGVSVEDQQRADERIPLLLQTPAAVRFVSAEPLLGPVELTRISYIDHLRESLVKFARWSAEKEGRDIEAAAQEAAASVTDEGLPNGEKPNIDCLSGRWFDGWDSGDDCKKLDWVIVGGESGPGARPMHPDWVRSIRDQCQEAGVPFFFKQWGEWLPFAARATYAANSLMPGNAEVVGGDCGGPVSLSFMEKGLRLKPGQCVARWNVGHKAVVRRISVPQHKWGKQQLQSMEYVAAGKKAAGHLLDGREWRELPEVKHGRI